MGHLESLILIISTLSILLGFFATCSKGQRKLLDECSSDEDCAHWMYCFSCPQQFLGSRCVRKKMANQFEQLNNSLPFNKYAYLTTHNSFAINGKPFFTNQEDSITDQLKNGVRAFMLDTYDYKGDVWLCHSYNGQCFDYTKFSKAIDTFREIYAFLSTNPREIVTLILEDYVHSPNGLSKVFNDSGVSKYWFPTTNMPLDGNDWPLVIDMVTKDHRLVVFTSNKSKQQSEGIAYQWNYMVENQYDGDDGIRQGSCTNRTESASLDDKSKSLVLVNFFKSIPVKSNACYDNSAHLAAMLQTCYGVAGNRWANFVAVDFYKRGDGGGAFQAVNMLNGKWLCGCDDVHACIPGSTSNASTSDWKEQLQDTLWL